MTANLDTYTTGARHGAEPDCAAATSHAVRPAPARSTRDPRFCSPVCFHAWQRQRLDELAAQLRGPEPARDAESAAADWLAGRGGPARITEFALCEFLWYQLPVAPGSVADRVRTAAALGRRFEALGLSRYARLCTAAETVGLLHRYDSAGVPAGRLAYRRMLHRSGLVPPPVPELTWGTVMGVREMEAYEATAAMLELAIVTGALVPGTAGWLDRQAELTQEYLQAPGPQRGGASRLHEVRAERFETWARSRGPVRRTLLAGLSGRLGNRTAMPPEALEHLAPLRWLLDRADRAGLPLTGDHRFSPTVVVEAQEWFGVDAAGSALPALQELLYELRAVRRSGRRLVPTRRGRHLLADPERLWSAVVAALLGPLAGIDGAVREAALIVLADGRQVAREELARRVDDVLAGEGWGAVDAATARPALARLWRRLYALGLLGDERWLRPVRLNPAGQAAALAALRTRAARPRRSLGFGSS
jgi:hypothetical protein